MVFREYIQNSVDSIDEATRTGVLLPGAEQISVRLAPTENQIVIYDNGLGIPTADAEKTLISIGNSKKSSESSRGFRGIGRLSALSYCQQLTFITSFKGESVGTKIVIDASKLSEVLADDTKADVTVIDVLESVYTVSTFSEREDLHYFSVQLDGVDVNSKLLSCAEVEDYLTQNAPAPYSPDFIWGKEITKRLQKEGLEISAYNISLEYGTKVKPIYKPYGEGKNAVAGTGGNFSFYDLGEPLLVGDCLNEAVAPEKIREYIWFMETKTPYAPLSSGNPYYLGQHNSTGYYFYYEPQRVTVLDYAFLATIKEKADGTVIYADRCSIGEDKLAQMGITFKKIPRDISRL